MLTWDDEISYSHFMNDVFAERIQAKFTEAALWLMDANDTAKVDVKTYLERKAEARRKIDDLIVIVNFARPIWVKLVETAPRSEGVDKAYELKQANKAFQSLIDALERNYKLFP
jgi:hypothetical protein